MKYTDLRARINQAIEDQNESVLELVQSKRVDAEIRRRADLVAKGFDLFISAEEARAKIKPSAERFDKYGVPVDTPSYTRDQISQRSKLAQTIERLDSALGEAILNSNYGSLEKATNKS